eukprot:TRINITY_DN156_c0_g1_i1.p1 TRINITY_DN156_c0_g1~~TRINITY_DN156_c0_g1_i1.p1  ORF type:complete len:72 (-),score=0.71 TRINITY_DN156_c0_g1_i1:219-434(-)
MHENVWSSVVSTNETEAEVPNLAYSRQCLIWVDNDILGSSFITALHFHINRMCTPIIFSVQLKLHEFPKLK